MALMGAHGTGKTTLSKALVERLGSSGIKVQSLPEAPRQICNRAGDPTFFRRGNNTPLRQDLILLVHLIQELAALLNDAEVVISDRSLLDHWAYTLYLFKEELVEEGLRTIYEEFIMDHCRRYDVIFFLPIEFAVVDDGTRENDAEFQRGIQQCMLGLLHQHALEALEVRGPLEDRVEFCLKAIRARLKMLDKVGDDDE